jgi:hypothetical protein
MTHTKEEREMKKYRWIKPGVGLGIFLLTLTLGCATKRPTPQITDTWTESAQRAETAAGRAEAAANRAEESAARVEASVKRIEDVAAQVEGGVMRHMMK